MDLEETESGILPRSINETESRRLALVMNLIKYKQGISFQKIRKIMPEFYSNENIESDQKKLSRDIEDISELGIKIKFKRQNEFGDNNLYFIDSENFNKFINFTNEELEVLGEAILENWSSEYSKDLFSASQKIFHSNLKLFPEIKEEQTVDSLTENFRNGQILADILKSVKDKYPIEITYYKSLPNEVVNKIIDPLHVTKRNSSDFYLLAFDRETKEKKRYLIPKISRVKELDGEFIASKKLTDKDLNYHALNFPVHMSEQIEFICNSIFNWKLENYLFPHPFIKEDNKFTIETTNKFAFFSFILKEPDVILSVNSDSFRVEFNKFLETLKEKYNN